MDAPVERSGPVSRGGWWVGALTGIVATGLGLALGEVVAGLSRSLQSPIIAVGERFIDLTPAWLKDWAIDTFGTDNKRALLVGIGVVLALASAWVGALVWRRQRAGGASGWPAALTAAGLLGLVGAAAVLGQPGARWWHVLPVVVAAGVAAVTLVGLLRWLVVAPQPRPHDPRPTAPMGAESIPQPHVERPWASEVAHDARSTPLGVGSRAEGAEGPAELAGPGVAEPTGVAEPMRVAEPMGVDRRRVLVGTLGVGAAALAVGAFGRALQGRFSNAAARAAVVLPRPSRRLAAAPADPALDVDGLSTLFTPNDRFFRIDTAIVPPSVDPDSWQLRIHGLVERELTLSYDELLALPLVEADVTLSCVSNEVGGSLVGNARWLGVRLDELLDRVGVSPDADQVMGRSVDAFTAGFPVSTLDGRDALVAVGMNGEVLPVRHGFPARLVVPGLYGYVSATKWLSEIELTRFDEQLGYWIPRGWAREAPVLTQSRIDRPRGGSLDAGPVVVAGVAWAPHRGVERVEVQVDEGPWREAALGPSVGDDAWRQWWIEWDATPGQHTLRCRATDGAGAVQVEERTPVAPRGATGWHARRFRVA